MKVFHCADIHLDSPLRGLEAYDGAPVDEIRGAPRQALINLIDLAIAEDAAAVIIAGDLYDGDWSDFNTGLFFASQVGRLREAGIKAFIVRGNHDAASRITRRLVMPDNVHVFPTDRAETVQLEKLGIALHGHSFEHPATFDDLAAGYPAAIPGLINIGILHTALSGHSDHERYAPCTLQQLVAAGYDYWALGHVHQRAIVHERPWIVFPGNLQGRHIKESGSKGCTVVTIENGAIAAIEHRPVDKVRFARVTVNVAGARNVDDALERALERLREAVAEADGRLLCVRVELFGACAAHSALLRKRVALLQQIRSLAFGIAGALLWIERVETDLRPGTEPATQTMLGPAGAEIQAAIEEFRGSPDAFKSLICAVEPMLRRLPLALREQIEGNELVDPAKLAQTVERLVIARLAEQEERV